MPDNNQNHSNQEYVVLVDEHNNVLGTTPKATVHGEDTPLHRAFSAFIFNFFIILICFSQNICLHYLLLQKKFNI